MARFGHGQSGQDRIGMADCLVAWCDKVEVQVKLVPLGLSLTL